MDRAVDEPRQVEVRSPSTAEAWAVVASQLRDEMSPGAYSSWVEPLRPIGLRDGVFRIEAANRYACDWIEQRLNNRITRLLEVLYNQPVRLRLSVWKDGDSAATMEAPAAEQKANGRSKRKPVGEEREEESEGSSPRKIKLQRAYGTERARVIKPEQAMFITKYFLFNWLPLLGHSAFAVVLAARALCYWNPMNGDIRNTLDTEMKEIAKKSELSVRTVKAVLSSELVRKYFLRYKVRKTMTANGIRTSGITLQVRMDDPLTPEDQERYNQPENERWFTADFDTFEELD